MSLTLVPLPTLADTADLVLNNAIADALQVIRQPIGTTAYRIARAELRLTLAGRSAERLLDTRKARP